MDRVLVGVDGSAAAHDALVWASDLALRAELEFAAIRVYAPTQAELRPDIDTALRDQQRLELERWCESLPTGGQPTSALLVDGRPAEALLATADQLRAGLLVVGGRGTSGPTHVHMGSVAQALTQHTTIPLAIVSNRNSTPLRHLVVRVDGSDTTPAAVGFVAELASRLGVGVTAVLAFEPFPEWIPGSDPQDWPHGAEMTVRSWVEPIENAGVDVEVDVDGDINPVAAIERALDAYPGCAAVVGAERLSAVSGLRLGRLPLQVVHHTGVPLILVPMGPTRPSSRRDP